GEHQRRDMVRLAELRGHAVDLLVGQSLFTGCCGRRDGPVRGRVVSAGRRRLPTTGEKQWVRARWLVAVPASSHEIRGRRLTGPAGEAMAGRDWPQVEGGPEHAAAARPAGQ